MSQEADQTPETWTNKFKKKFAENPLVPIGCLLTTGALYMSARKMRSGNSKDMQFWLRARVMAQGVTVLALVAGTLFLKTSKDESLEAAQAPTQTKLAELGKAKFEERLKDAVSIHAQEQALLAKQTSNNTNQSSTSQSSSTGAKSGRSWSSWLTLGLWKSKSGHVESAESKKDS